MICHILDSASQVNIKNITAGFWQGPTYYHVFNLFPYYLLEMTTFSSAPLPQSLSNIRYFTCPKGSLHEGEPLNRICIQKKCPQQGLICVICEEEDHKLHETIPVKQFLSMLVAQNKTKYQGAVDSLIAIQQMRSSIEEAITFKRKEVELEFQKLENAATRYFVQVEQLAKNLFHAQGSVQKIVEDMIYGNQENLSTIMKKMKTVLEIVDMGEDKQFSIHNLLDFLLIDTTEKGAKVSQTLIKLANDSAKTIQGLTEILEENIAFPDSKDNYKWSLKLKGAKINVNGPVAEQTGMESSGQRFILMEQDLSKSSKKKTWGIKIKKLGGWIGVGISLKSQIVGSNFNFHYTTIGHGSYLISTNGYSWSHSVKEYNSALKCFTFAIGDTVYIEYNPLLGKLKFRKNESLQPKDQFELDVVAPPQGDCYHPCANLCSTNDSVEIVHPGKPLS